MNQSSNLRSNAHAVIIGINEYQDEKIPDLQFARADAEGVYQILTDPELGRIPTDNVILLLDENATQQNIRSAIGDEIPRRAGENDFVYIYFAGHGLPFINPKSGSADGMEKYLVPVDAKLDRIRGTGIPMDDIQRFFGYLQSKQVMFFIDSCFSGEAGGRTFQNPAYQTRHGFLSAEFLDNLSGEGRLVVTACDVNELSIETSTMGHGLFTHYLMEGLKGRADKDQDGLVTIHELYDYVYDHVSQHALRLGGSMHPIQKGSIKGKIPLTLYETPTQKQAKSLDDQAQALFKAEKFGEAYELWHQVINLVPNHSGAEQGLAEVEKWLKEKERKRQEILERKQRFLLQLNREGQLPSEEFDSAMELIEKSSDELTALERETRRLLDEFIDKKISAASYVKSVRLLRKPAEPEPALKIEKAAPVATKSESKKIPEAKPALPKAAPAVEKVKPIAPKIEPEKMPRLEDAKALPAAARRKWTTAVSGTLILIVITIIVLILSREERKTEPPQQQAASESIALRKNPATQPAPTTAKAKMVPLDIKLPKPMFIGTPSNLQVPNLEKPLGKPRPPFLAPEGTTNVALGKSVSSSDEAPVIGELKMITDGNNEAGNDSYVELGPFLQNVTIDLGKKHNIYAILLWHYHKQPRVYFDVVVQVADDPNFTSNVSTLYNNDIDNSVKMGTGTDKHYVETSEGRLIDAKGVQGRYVRLYSNGNTNDDLNHYIEVAVYGKSTGTI